MCHVFQRSPCCCSFGDKCVQVSQSCCITYTCSHTFCVQNGLTFNVQEAAALLPSSGRWASPRNSVQKQHQGNLREQDSIRRRYAPTGGYRSSSLPAGQLEASESVEVRGTMTRPGHAELQAGSETESFPGPGVRECPPPPRMHKTGTAQTCILIVKSFLGGAFLFLPHAMLKGGVVLSVCTLLSVFLVALYSINLLLRCSASGKEETYEQLGEKAFGACGRVIVEACVVLSQLSFCTINAVVVWGNLRDVIWTISGCSPAHKWSVVALMWLGALYFIPASLITNLKYLSPLMLIGNAGMAVSVLLLLVAVSLVRPAAFWTGAEALALWENWPMTIGTSILMWEGAGLIVPIRNAATKKVQDRFPLVRHWFTYAVELFSACLGALLALYIGFTLYCIAVLGQELEVVVLANLPPGPLSLTVQTLFALSVMATYPLLLLPASNIAEGRLLPNRKRLSACAYTLLRSLLRAFLVILTLLAASVGLKQLDSFVALVGSLCGAPLTFLCPPLLHIRLQKGTPTLLLLLHYAVVLTGACIVVFSIYWALATWRGSGDFPARCNSRDN